MEDTKQQKITTPMAIVIAGVLIMGGILLTNGGGISKTTKEKTLSEQVGVSKDKLAECVKGTDLAALSKSIETDVAGAMKGVPDNQKGTPYSVIIGTNGVKTEILGAESYENVKKAIDEVTAGKVTLTYTGDIAPISATDHIFGNPNAPVVIVEYSDFECPYCKKFHVTLKQAVDESSGNVAWVYRNWPLHQNSLEKLVAAECVAKIKGNDAYWKYGDLLFGMLKTASDSVTDQL